MSAATVSSAAFSAAFAIAERRRFMTRLASPMRYFQFPWRPLQKLGALSTMTTVAP